MRVDYKNAAANADGDDMDGNPDWERYFNTLSGNSSRDQGEYSLDVTKLASGSFAVVVVVDNQSWEYNELPISSMTNFRVQSHWGSGVVFSNMKAAPKSSP